MPKSNETDTSVLDPAQLELIAAVVAKAVAASGNSSAETLAQIVERMEANAPIRKVTYAELISKRPKRPKLAREYYQHTRRISERQISDQEIALLNQITPGKYIDGLVAVTERGSAADPQIYIDWDCKTADQRMTLAAKAPSFYAILKRIVEEATARHAS
jgi:hypothetical protein